MKTEIKVETDTYINGQKQRETPYVNGQKHGISTWWYENGQKQCEIPYINGQVHGLEIWLNENGQKRCEIPYVNGQKHGLAIWWHLYGSLGFVRKWHQSQEVWRIQFPSQEQISEDVELELFFHETPELI